MKRIWSCLSFILITALVIFLGVRGSLAQIYVPIVEPPDVKYVPGEVLVKFKDLTLRGGHGPPLRGDQAREFAATLPAQARFALEEIRGNVVRAFPSRGILQVKLPIDITVPAAVKKLRQTGVVEHAEPNFLFYACPKPDKPDNPNKPDKKPKPPTDEPPPDNPATPLSPNDPFFGDQWALNSTGQTFYTGSYMVYGTPDADIDAPEAWGITSDGFTDSSSTLVVVIDTGVGYTHPDLAASMWTNPDENPEDDIDNDGNGYVDDVHGINALIGSGDPMDDHGHGTHCAGIMGAQGNNNVGVSGVAWNAKIMALKFLDSSGSGSEADAIECIDYALDMKEKYNYPQMVMSNSWGSYLKPEDSQPPIFLGEAISRAKDLGVIFVAAAGNNGFDIDRDPVYPASYDLDNIISVGASDEDDKVAFFTFASNYGQNNVDLFAPGTFILSTYSIGFGWFEFHDYAFLDGTSMACPHVSGAAALVWGKAQGAEYPTIKNLILNNVDQKDTFTGKCVTGGRLNLYNSLAAAISQ